MRSKHHLLSVLLALFVLGGCRVDTVLTVQSAEDGSGTVSVSVTLDQGASALDGDLDAILQGARSAGTGWDISVRRTVDSTTIVAAKEFANPGEAEAIVTELSGVSGPLGALRFDVDASIFTIESRVAGRLDLQERAVAAFQPTDPALLAILNGLGLDLEDVRSRLRGAGDDDFTMAVMTDLPGNEGNNSTDVVKTVPRWTVTVGEAIDLSASSTQGRWARIAPVSVVLVVVLVALRRVWRRRRRATTAIV